MKILSHSKTKMLGLFLFSTLFLASCGGGSETTTSSTAPVDANLFQESSIAPIVNVYGLNESSLVSKANNIQLRGTAKSPSGKTISITQKLNSSPANNISLNTDGSFIIDLVLLDGDNKLVLAAEDIDGLKSEKSITITHSTNSAILNGLTFKDSYIKAGSTKTAIASISFSETSNISSVDLLKYPSASLVASMKDDGVLPDEIKQDGLFSIKFDLTATSQSNECFRARVNLTTGGFYNSGISCLQVYKDYTNEELQMRDSFQVIISKMYADSKKINRNDKAQDVVSRMKANSEYHKYFQNIYYDVYGNIYFKLLNGLDGSFTPSDDGTLSVGKIGDSSKHLIDPYDGVAGYKSNIFTSQIDGEIFTAIPYIIKKNSVDSFKNMASSGILNIYTHGGNDKLTNTTWLSSGEQVLTYTCPKTTEALFITFNYDATCYESSKYAEEIKSNQIKVSSNGYYLINVNFLKNNNKSLKLSNSLVWLTSCHTAENDDLRSFFFDKGAAAYVGYVHAVQASYATDLAKEFYKNLMINGSVSQSMIAAKDKVGQNDTFLGYIAGLFTDNLGWARAELSFNGVTDLLIPDLSLKNGDFESSSISPWQQSGDARVISTLGQYLPMDGKNMGILSTGLGYTTTSGTISQKALIQNTNSTLKFSWNYMSEEFKQYCGSSYQDYFKVTACKKDGTCDTLLNKKVNDFCSSVVQSNVILNNGKPAVWATGWQNQTIDISAYRGKAITFKFEASDIGDSAYDTAVLLDGIKIE